MIAAIVRTASVLAVLLLAGCSFYLSEPRVPKTDLRATLNGSNEVPPTQSRGISRRSTGPRPRCWNIA
jgi:hypothetical protein